MTVRRGGCLAIVLLSGCLSLWAAACHTQFRFDDHSIDANRGDTEGDVRGAPEVAACQTARCGYEEESCTPARCQLECPHNGNCTGLCGANCTGDCEEDSQCTLTTGSRARLRCEARAHCLYSFGDDSEARCEVGSRCDIVCLGACALTCDKGAKCAFACSLNDPLTSFSGSARCP
jgi:hypothetical protein